MRPVSNTFNTIVLGLGAMGSSALYQLAKRGDKVLGIDQFSPPHTLGSTHGDTRITRQAIGEGEQYVPLTLRSYEIFREIEKEVGEKLLEITGGLIIASKASRGINHVEEFFENTVHAAGKFNIKHDVLDATELRKRFPQFQVRDNEVGYYEHEAGMLYPEKCIAANLTLAEKHGAVVHRGERVISFVEANGGVKVITDQAEYHAAHLVVSAGPWLQEIIDPQYADLFKVYRQVLYWFDIEHAHSDFALGKFPIFIWEAQGVKSGMYGFPAIDGAKGGLKIAREDYSESTTPDTVNRVVTQHEIDSMFNESVAPFFPAVRPTCVKSAVCLYTVTPDAGFVIDHLPSSKSIILCSPCSGHGFKHSAAVGESIAQMVLDGSSKIDLAPFRLHRFLQVGAEL
jgi:sarcosine oxidase